MADPQGGRLRVEGITVTFGGVSALTDVSFEAKSGQVLGFIGPNGAGKTTLFDVISGFTEPSAGRVLMDGVDLTSMPAEARSAAGLGRSFQDARLFPSLTVKENLKLAFERYIKLRGLAAIAGGISAQRAEERSVELRAEELIELLGVSAFRDKFVSELSTGSRRVVDLAMILAHQPRVLLLDEPSSGIAQRETEALGPLILSIREQLGCTILVIEHDMPLITSVSDEIVALEVGRVIARGAPLDVLRDRRVVSSYLGGSVAAVQRSGRGRGKRGEPTVTATAVAAGPEVTDLAPAKPPAPWRGAGGGPSWTHRLGVVATSLVLGGAIYLARSVPVISEPTASAAAPPRSPAVAASPAPEATLLPVPDAPPAPLYPAPPDLPAPAAPATPLPAPSAPAPAHPTPGPTPSPTPSPSGSPGTVQQICAIVPTPVCPPP